MKEQSVYETDFRGYKQLNKYPKYRINLKKGWIINSHNKRLGRITKTGYRLLGIEGKGLLEHRLIYEHRHGDIEPNHIVDHIDRNKLNNSISNLKLIQIHGSGKKSKNNIFARIGTDYVRPIKVIDYYTNEEKEFPSMYKASKYADVNAGMISMLCKTNTHTRSAYSKDKKKRWKFKFS